MDICTITQAKTRRSRMRRTGSGKRIELTPRDLEIFKLLARYRYLRSTYIHAFVRGNRTKLIERLGDLYHEAGYIDRPEEQWQTINARYTPVVYELGEAGAQILQNHGFAEEARYRPGGQGRSRRYFHELMACDATASIELATLATGGRCRFVSSAEILASAKMPAATRDASDPWAISVPIAHVCVGTNKQMAYDRPLIPDAVFGIEYRGAGQKSYRFFVLEADRNTEPLIRSDFGQSSYLRKVLQYKEIISQALYRSRWGVPNLLVLNVTTSERHMRGLVRLVADVASGAAANALLFRAVPQFATIGSAREPIPDLLTGPWQRAGLAPLVL